MNLTLKLKALSKALVLYVKLSMLSIHMLHLINDKFKKRERYLAEVFLLSTRIISIGEINHV